ncbi:dienelactone hydrolase [Paractinoplanes deccanensis]|uniref:Dienelactone hydrolase n=1 Tax=Paractinoplanes deccanensis TaxID=113561 RepID=A0ABQ3YCK4_9ACTN|nr:dienelactone hydrolase family protein [Actinoplanes deccanensis]GID77699.1 dienelactone hydrolase [Actinoplanes deccanensis]
MASVALFHSVYGLRPAMLTAAERLRAAGHTVVAPDLYGLPPADTVEEGFTLADKVGWAAITDRARAALRDLPPETVLAGFSMGVGVVEALLPERPRAAGVLLVASAGSLSRVPPGLRAQLHVADPDPEFVPPESVQRWTESMARAGAAFEVYRYPGVGHLWPDEDLSDYDRPAADRLWQRCEEFLRLS